jgi:hypothetical protein
MHVRVGGAALLLSLAAFGVAPSASADEPEPAPRWPWIAPGVQIATIGGATALSLANGLDPGRLALDTTFASLGAGVGVLGLALLFNHGHTNDVVRDVVVGIPVTLGALTLGGLALGEVIRSSESPLPQRTVGPALGGLVVGAVVDLAAIGVAMSGRPPNDGATLTTAILLPLTAGATTVAGYSITR